MQIQIAVGTKDEWRRARRLGRKTADRPLPAFQVIENPPDHARVMDAGNDLHAAAAVRAGGLTGPAGFRHLN